MSGIMCDPKKISEELKIYAEWLKLKGEIQNEKIYKNS